MADKSTTPIDLPELTSTPASPGSGFHRFYAKTDGKPYSKSAAGVEYPLTVDTSTFVTASSTNTFTNKTFNANGTGNSISNIEVADFATGVVDTDLSSVSASDDTLPSAKATKTALDAKQATLVSGTSIKTINSTSLLGSGDIAITGNATHTGDVTGSTALTIANDAVTNAKLANVATATIKGRNTAGTGDPEDLSTSTVRTMLSINNIDNTSDANKPISTATQTALNAKENSLPSKTGNALKVIRVNASESAFEYATVSTSEAWPIGSVFISVVSTNPNTLLGYGTWTAFATGRTIVGIDAGQTEFDTVEETGGSKTHTLTSTEMPSHTHVQDAHTHTVTDPGHVHSLNMRGTTTNAAGGAYITGSTGSSSSRTSSDLPVSNTTGITNQSTTATNQNTGGGAAHNNLQPYIVTYMWKRVS